MHIPSGVIVPILIVSFVMLYLQYFRLDPDRRILNVRFGLMLGAVVLIVASVFNENWSLTFFVVALVWLGLSYILLRQLPPRDH
jgi:O-antigen/teichoic acid export membrane protein